MRESAVMFRLPGHVLANVETLASRLNLSVNLIAKLIVIREIMNIPAMLEEHDKQLANMHQFLREMAFHNDDFLNENEERRDEAAEAVMAKLKEVMHAIDSIRDAAFVRPSTYIADLIRQHDERPVQESLGV
ncbi:valyl-tRNA synthetase [Mesorhizobium shonense]|uniref:Valyl-tRNA synthetase n=1 Tax=Mesorhizobium shonense TaxID=1209948 RepID=A0ABV2HX73_9HYPH